MYIYDGENIREINLSGLMELFNEISESMKEKEEAEEQGRFAIKDVRFDGPATIVWWEDGEKTIVKCMKEDVYDKYTGIAMCTLKYLLGEQFQKYKKVVEAWVKETDEREKKKKVKNAKQ